MKPLLAALGLPALIVVGLGAQSAITSNEAARLSNAAQALREIDQSIPVDLLARARCVAVVPDLKKAAFVVGGEYGKGVMSCRALNGWSAPVFLQLAKGSWGFQIGAEQVDVVMLVMNESGVEKLLRDKVSLGADASVAAGPIGRQGHVGTDAQLTAEILSYSRAQGLFAGIDLSGGVLRPDEDANRNAYGRGASARTILASTSISAPTEASAFLSALASQVPSATTNTRSAADAPEAEPSSAQGRATIDDGELRTRIADLRATLDRLLDSSTPVGTTGTTKTTTSAGTESTSGATVAVDRAQLLQLRQQLDALVLALDRRK